MVDYKFRNSLCVVIICIIFGLTNVSIASIQVTTTFQQGAIINSYIYNGNEDTYLYIDEPNINYGSSDSMLAGRSDSDEDARIILRFDTSALPADADIISAKLYLYCLGIGGSTPGLVSIYRMDRTNWVEDKANWNKYDSANSWTNAGGDYNSTLIASWNPVGNNPGWAEYDVAEIVKGYINGIYDPKAGFLLRSTDVSSDFTEFVSSEHTDQTKHPKLVVTYNTNAPTANAGPDQDVGKNANVTLNGTTSSDPNENQKALTYKWHFISKPLGSNLTDNSIVPNNTTGVNGTDTATFTADALGIYEIELRVTNSLGLYSIDTVKISSFYVKSGHPRIWLTDDILIKLKAKAIANTPQWQELKSQADEIDEYSKSDIIRACALVYQITGDPVYAQKAFSLMDSYLGYDISWDSGYNARLIPPALSVGFDWCYDQLTQAQKSTYINQLNAWRDVYLKPGAWSETDPADNYFYGYLFAEGLSGIATYGDNPRAREFIDDARNYRFEQISLPFLNTTGKGGDWGEGWSYGAGSMMHLNKYIQAVKTATGEDLFKYSLFFRDVVLNILHITLPSMSHLYPSGDWARESTGRICDYFHSFMSILSSEFISEDLGQYAKWWIDNTDEEEFDFLAWERFLWEDPDYPSKNYTLYKPLYYYAPGTGLITARSGWGSDATWVSFKCGVRAGSHSHFDQNTFTIFKHEWIAPDVNIYSHSGCQLGTEIHNSILIDDKGQTYYPSDISKIDKYEFAQDYVYVCGEATGDYNELLNGLNNNILETFTRSFVYLKPDYVVVFDRVISVNPNSTKKWLLHSKNEPVISGNTASSVNGNGKLFLKVLCPENFSINKAQFTTDMIIPNWCITVQPNQLQKQNNFLNVLYAADSSIDSMPPATFLVDGTNMIGTQIADRIAMFSKEEKQLDSAQFNVTGLGMYKTIIADLIPNTIYKVFIDGNLLGIYTSKDSGLMSFDLPLNGTQKVTLTLNITLITSQILAKTTPPPPSPNVWNIVGPSVITLDKSIVNNFGTGFGTTWIAWRWNPTLSRWEAPTTFGSNPVTTDPFDAGTSWLYALDGDGSYITKSVQGTPVDTSISFSAPLKIGWNLICNPFDFSVAWSDSVIKIKYGAWEGTPTQAESAGYVDNRAIWYNPDTKANVTRYSNEATPYVMPKTRGQWLYSAVNGAYVMFPPIEYNGSPAPPSKPKDDSSLWKVELTLRSSKGSDTVEAISDNKGQVSLHDMKPPSLPISTSSISFIREDRELSSDRQRESNEMMWTFSTDTTEVSSLEWKLIGVPEGYKLTLEDETGKEIDVRQVNNLPIDKGKSVHRYILKATRASVPKVTRLLANYPNPFNPDTWIPYELSEVSEVVIKIYTTTGYLVRTLSLGRKEGGYYTTKESSAYWDGKNEYGEQSASGVYFYSIKAGDYTSTRKMVILK